MAKATDAQVRAVEEALKNGEPLPEGIRLNFGDPEPVQKHDAKDGREAPAENKK